MTNNLFDPESFEKDWRRLSIEICQAIYISPQIQTLKHSVQKNGFLSPEEKSSFIDICNQVKYAVIQKHYGAEGSPGYQAFNDNWREWFQKKGVESQKSHGQTNSVEHIMFGSTPEPARFLLHFEHEVLGSIR